MTDAHVPRPVPARGSRDTARVGPGGFQVINGNRQSRQSVKHGGKTPMLADRRWGPTVPLSPRKCVTPDEVRQPLAVTGAAVGCNQVQSAVPPCSSPDAPCRTYRLNSREQGPVRSAEDIGRAGLRRCRSAKCVTPSVCGQGGPGALRTPARRLHGVARRMLAMLFNVVRTMTPHAHETTTNRSCSQRVTPSSRPLASP